MALRDEGCAARAVIQQLDATAATKNEVQRISTIYVGGKQDTSDFAILRRVYMCDVDGCAVPLGRFGSLRPAKIKSAGACRVV